MCIFRPPGVRIGTFPRFHRSSFVVTDDMKVDPIMFDGCTFYIPLDSEIPTNVLGWNHIFRFHFFLPLDVIDVDALTLWVPFHYLWAWTSKMKNEVLTEKPLTFKCLILEPRSSPRKAPPIVETCFEFSVSVLLPPLPSGFVPSSKRRPTL